MNAATLRPGRSGAARTASGQVGGWLARAWRRLGWRQVALAALINVLAAAFGPGGGVFLFPGQRATDPFAQMLSGRWVCLYLPVIFAAMVADEAHEEGAGTLVAYGSALILGALAAALLDAWVGVAMGWNRGGPWHLNGFRLKQALLQGSLSMAVYAYWRSTRRTLRRVQAAESERVLDRQRLLAARLMALQARVEPQFLFDALSRIGAMHERDPDAADALLADLIALLRAMLPLGTAATSTVEREFALAAAWLRVQRHLGVPLDVDIAASPLAATSSLGAMLVLPLLEEMQAEPHDASLRWRLSAELTPSSQTDDAGTVAPRTPRLVLRLAPAVPLPEHAVEAPPTPGVTRLRERLAELHGDAATLSVALLGAHAPAFELDLPIVQETAPR